MTHQRLLGRFHGSDLRIALGNHRLSLDSGSQSLIRCSTGQISLFPSLQRFSVSQTRSRDSVPRGLDSLIRLRKGGLGRFRCLRTTGDTFPPSRIGQGVVLVSVLDTEVAAIIRDDEIEGVVRTRRGINALIDERHLPQYYLTHYNSSFLFLVIRSNTAHRSLG